MFHIVCGLQVTERIISDGRLLAKSLTADVERITREKQVAQERAETTKVRVMGSVAAHVAVITCSSHIWLMARTTTSTALPRRTALWL